MNSIATLLTCHNRCKKTLDCIQALYDCSLPENYILNVYLVDDGSTDGTSEAVKVKFPKVNLIQGTGSLFWNRGMRLAWESASMSLNHDFYLWLNDDTILVPQAISLLIKQSEIEKNRKIIVGTTCSHMDENFTYGGYKFYSEKIIPNGDWQECDYFNGNIVIVPSLIYQKVGYLDSRYRHAFGDFDYGRRAKKMGFRHLVSPIYLGYCERHDRVPLWIDKSISLSKRLKILYSPLGNNPFEFFILDRYQSGLFIALFHIITLHLRTIFPEIWMKKR